MPKRLYTTNRQRRRATTRVNNAYKKRSQTAFTLRFHNENDAEVIRKLQEQDNKIDYVRQLILKDING